jgi:hypothetical protein
VTGADGTFSKTAKRLACPRIFRIFRFCEKEKSNAPP